MRPFLTAILTDYNLCKLFYKLDFLNITMLHHHKYGVNLDIVFGLIIHAKEKNVPQSVKRQFGHGDVWTWTAIEAQTKLIIAWHVGRRYGASARVFVQDVARRILKRI